MRRTVPAAVALAALLAAPQGAAGKGYAAASVCGTNGCHPVDSRAVRTGFEDFTPAPTPRAAPFLTIRLRARVSSGRIADVYALEWLPSENVTRGDGERLWTRPGATLGRALRRAARGLRPSPAAGLRDLRERPAARVVEVFAPAREHGHGPSTATLGAAALGLAAVAGVRRRRRSDRPSTTPR
jgi:MYXO-CTERM domain-containing protein